MAGTKLGHKQRSCHKEKDTVTRNSFKNLQRNMRITKMSHDLGNLTLKNRFEFFFFLKNTVWGSGRWECNLCIPFTKRSQIPFRQGTNQGYRFDSQLGCMSEATDQCFFFTSMFLSLSFPHSLKKAIKTYPQLRI